MNALSRREREQQHSSGFVMNALSRWERDWCLAFD